MNDRYRQKKSNLPKFFIGSAAVRSILGSIEVWPWTGIVCTLAAIFCLLPICFDAGDQFHFHFFAFIFSFSLSHFFSKVIFAMDTVTFKVSLLLFSFPLSYQLSFFSLSQSCFLHFHFLFYFK